MVVRKLSVFLLVIAFHVVVLGVVYLATRSGEPEKKTEKPNDEKIVENKETKTDTTPKKDIPKPDPIEDEKPKYDYVFHTVAKGDYLSGIANKYKVSTKSIMDVNNLKDANKIFLGQKLKIPVSN